MHPAIAEKREALAALCRRYGVAHLEVFGSAARGHDFDPARSVRQAALLLERDEEIRVDPAHSRPRSQTCSRIERFQRFAAPFRSYLSFPSIPEPPRPSPAPPARKIWDAKLSAVLRTNIEHDPPRSQGIFPLAEVFARISPAPPFAVPLARAGAEPQACSVIVPSRSVMLCFRTGRKHAALVSQLSLAG